MSLIENSMSDDLRDENRKLNDKIAALTAEVGKANQRIAELVKFEESQTMDNRRLRSEVVDLKLALQKSESDAAIWKKILEAEELPTFPCPYEGHDARWCSYCEARNDGMENYREWLRKKITIQALDQGREGKGGANG